MSIFRRTRYQKVIVVRQHKPSWVRAHPAVTLWLVLATFVVIGLLMR